MPCTKQAAVTPCAINTKSQILEFCGAGLASKICKFERKSQDNAARRQARNAYAKQSLSKF